MERVGLSGATRAFQCCLPAGNASKMFAVSSTTHMAELAPRSLTWVKADLHLHTAEDPLDEIDYSAEEILHHAHGQGFRVLAITLHDKVFDDHRVFARARELGVLLIQAAELRIEGADVVILNVTPQEAATLQSFEDLRRLRARRGDTLLTFAPHPFYRAGGSIGHRLEALVDCFDAIEHCHFHVPLFNPNIPAARLAKRHGLALIATSDAHRRRFFGDHYSLLGLEDEVSSPTIENVFAAIRAHRVERVSPTGGLPRLLSLLLFLFVIHPLLVRLPSSKRVQARKLARNANAPGRRSIAPARVGAASA